MGALIGFAWRRSWRRLTQMIDIARQINILAKYVKLN
jgi:hypothetical protein